MESPETDWLLDECGAEDADDSVEENVPDNRCLNVQVLPDENKEEALARTVLRPDVQASITIAQTCNGALADVGLTELPI